MIKHIVRMSSSKFTNRLALEKSPYLLQHKNNPIEWFPWGSEAFELAKSKNRPIFLSVGYSTCHWCHVMEKESFENAEIAKLLNDNFVSIKVDREERPDVDKLYMAFVTAISGHGGWPMTVFLTPDLAPITGGTYFPPDDNRGMLGFPTILNMIVKEWTNGQESIVKQGKDIIELLKQRTSQGEVNNYEDIMTAVFTHKLNTFDSTQGGFGRAPKFPKASDLDFLIAYAGSMKNVSNEKAKECIKMLETTLEAMALGGICDHIGKGFHRYSVDKEWHVPHFEKMLYDQTQLLATYSEFHRLTGRKNSEVSRVIQDIYEYLDKMLSHPDGGFYAAEDADSYPTDKSVKKMEGAFCVWEKKEVESLLGSEKVGSGSLFEVFCEYFDVEDNGNVPRSSDPHGELTNKNVLRRLLTNEECAKNFNITVENLLEEIETAKKILWAARKNRPKPHLDSKMVTAWQGLAITGLVKAYQALGNTEYLTKAEQCKIFVQKYLLNEENELIRAVYLSENGDGKIEQKPEVLKAFSDDYAFVIQGFLDLYTINGDSQLLKLALDLQLKMDSKFWNGSAYYVSEENEKLGVTVRLVEDQDGAEPCASSVAANNLLRLHDILERDDFKEKALSCFKGASEILNKSPIALPKMVIALNRLKSGSTTVVMVGDPTSDLLKKAKELLNQTFIPNLSVVHISGETEDDVSATGASHIEMSKSPSPAVFICEGFVCDRPLKTVSQLEEKFSSF